MRRILRLPVIGVAAITMSGAGSAQSADSIWNDPIFKRQFVAAYGFDAEVEPRATPKEVEILEKIRPLMAVDLSKAQSTLAERMQPDCSAILDFTLGGIHFQQDHLAEARASYERAVAKFPSFRRAWRNLGLIHARNTDHDAAISAFTRMIELGGADAYAFGLLGISHFARQDYQPAEAAFRNALLLQPEQSEWRLGLTRCVVKQEKFEDAAALLDALIARFPEKSEFWLLQAHTFLGMKQPLRAAANLEAVEQLGKSTSDSLHTLGDVYASEDLLDLAERAYEKALAVDPAQSIARPLRSAEMLAARGANPQARRLAARIRESREGDLDDAQRRKLLKLEARLTMAEGGSAEEAVRLLQEVVQLDPLDGDALILLGQHHARNSDPDRAILYYERAASVEAFEATARLRHAQVLVGMSRYGEALPLLRRVQTLRPREDVARYLEQVERLSKAQR